MRRLILSLAAGLAIAATDAGSANAQFAAPPPGATSCSGCHAGPNNAIPSLTGLNASEIQAAMAAYRAGTREATVMGRIAKGFTEAETKDIAAWLSRVGAAQ